MSRLNVFSMSEIDVGNSCSVVSDGFSFLSSSVLLAAALGSVFGKSASKDERTKSSKLRIIYPNHHAPNHLGSLLSIVGVKVGAMYSFKQNEARPYPIAGPNIRIVNEKPGDIPVKQFITTYMQ